MVAGQTVTIRFFPRRSPESRRRVNVSAGTVENAYRVDNVAPGGPLGNHADPRSSLLRQCDFASVDRRHAIEKLQGGRQVPAAGVVPGDAGPGGSASRDPRHAGQQHAERPQRRDGNRGHHALRARRIRTDRGGQRTGRPAVWSGQSIRHVQLRHQAPHRRALRRTRTGLRKATVGHGAYRPRRTLRQERDVRLSHESAVGRWQRLCQRTASFAASWPRLRAMHA